MVDTLTRRLRRVRQYASFGLALPSVGWTVFFFLAPLAILVVYSFGQTNSLTLIVQFGWTFHNYYSIAKPLYRDALARSIFLSLAATGLCLLVGYPVAYWISRVSAKRQRLALLVIIVPFWTSFLVRIYAIANLVANGGPLQNLLHRLGLIGSSLGIQYSATAVAIGIVYSYLPLMVLPLYVALERIDPSLRQSASDLGASPWRLFRRVVVPLSAPGVIAGCILVGIPATGEYVIPAVLGGDKTLMFSNVITNQFLEVGDFSFGSALAVTLMAGVTVAAVVGRRFTQIAEDVT
jgi:ABC-type spermidine/putrescine transport system permease subunit I